MAPVDAKTDGKQALRLSFVLGLQTLQARAVADFVLGPLCPAGDLKTAFYAFASFGASQVRSNPYKAVIPPEQQLGRCRTVALVQHSQG
jgi:hypothetical protein